MNTHHFNSVLTQKQLYEQDFCLWIESTIKQIEAQEFDKIDWDNVIEELDSLGKSDKRELKNRLVVLLEQLIRLTIILSGLNLTSQLTVAKVLHQ